MNISNAVVLVTGGGSGIGRVLASEFARNGARVVCCGRRKEILDDAVAMITSEGGCAHAIQADVTRHDQVTTLVEKTLSLFGRIDVLFNNAGSFQTIAGVFEADPESWWHDVTVNLLGPFLCMREALPHMIKEDSGIIINMNGGRPPGGTSYAASKAGLMELTRLSAEELKHIHSNVIVFGAGPGLNRTDMTEYQATSPGGLRWIPGVRDALEAGNIRQPKEIARKTIELVTHAITGWSGNYYDPDTDIMNFMDMD